MNSYYLNDYLGDISNNNINNIILHIKKNPMFKKLIIFFMENNIKFYSCCNNNILIKDENVIILEINNIRNKIINNFIINLLKFNNSNDNFTIIKNIILHQIKLLEDIDILKKELSMNYSLLKNLIKVNNNIEQYEIIATYNNC